MTEVGVEAPSREFGPLTRQMFVRYSGASGDLNPMHYDDEFARSAGHPSVFAQGMFSAALLAGYAADPAAVFAEFGRRRKPNADAIAAMSLANYIEMRDGVADPHYLAKRELAAALTDRAPEYFMSRYRMVSFTRLPYSYCLQRGREQDALLESLLAGRAGAQGVDLDAAVARLRAELAPLPQA